MKILKICLLAIGSFILTPMFLANAGYSQGPGSQGSEQEEDINILEPGCYQIFDKNKEIIICLEETSEVVPVDPSHIEPILELAENRPVTVCLDEK